MTRIRFTLLSDTAINRQNTQNSSFQNTGYQTIKEMIYEKQQANEMDPTVPPAYCLERICRPWHEEGEPSWNLGVGRPRPLKFAG